MLHGCALGQVACLPRLDAAKMENGTARLGYHMLLVQEAHHFGRSLPAALRKWLKEISDTSTAYGLMPIAFSLHLVQLPQQ